LLFYELGRYLQAYDGQTRQLEWQLPDDQQVFGLAVADIDDDGALEVALIEGGEIVFYDALTFEPVHTSSVVWGPRPGDLMFVQLLSTSHPQLVIAGDEQLAIFYHPFDQEPIQSLDVAQAGVTWMDLDRDHYMDLLVGHQLGVTRYRMSEEFIDVAPPIARLLTPIADVDAVSLDTFARVSFDKAIKPDTIITDNIQLLVNGSPTAIDLSYDDETHILDLKPQSLLPPYSAITVWLEPNIQDLLGN
ncbi:MAG: Ig-like domain-containing protein, partial [Chloroflexi bacterium]|nr:Ig-like domain-containing protein [Chloroflexota bacterium]